MGSHPLHFDEDRLFVRDHPPMGPGGGTGHRPPSGLDHGRTPAGQGARAQLGGWPLAGHGANAVRDAIASSISTLPEQLRRSLTWYCPKGTDLSRHSRDELEAVASALNSRPRKTFGWKTLADALDD